MRAVVGGDEDSDRDYTIGSSPSPNCLNGNTRNPPRKPHTNRSSYRDATPTINVISVVESYMMGSRSTLLILALDIRENIVPIIPSTPPSLGQILHFDEWCRVTRRVDENKTYARAVRHEIRHACDECVRMRRLERATRCCPTVAVEAGEEHLFAPYAGARVAGAVSAFYRRPVIIFRPCD